MTILWALILVFLSSSVPVGSSALPIPIVRAEYYGELGCAHCDTFRLKELPAAESDSGVRVELEVYDILSTDGYKRCETRLLELGYTFTVFPVLIIGPSAFQGNAAIDAQLLPELEHYAKTGTFRSRFNGATAPAKPRLRWDALAILLAGLVDGINPCAFTTLLFFMSYLGLRGGSRRRMVAGGLIFASGVFLAYMLIGLGLFSVLRASGQLNSLRLALRVVVSIITAVFCALTVRDIVLACRGRPAEVSLKLPDSIRRRINNSIRSGVGRTAFLAGVFGTGVLVSILELACTGQVYFPAISVMIQTDGSWLGIGSLLLYNLAFITPLLIVLALSVFGVGQAAVRDFFVRHMVIAKGALAIAFATLAVLVWVV
ncbi:membrane protein [Spirochaetota bacterium]